MSAPTPLFGDPAQREARLLAPYAVSSARSAGRRHAESPHPYRTAFQRDRDRIVHCSAFRRLSHKTQVFTGELGDYHRTRLTHTLEVASMARTLARALRVNEDLVEALALLHDIGHPPFGHAGEEALDGCLAGAGGFDHNRQALRIVERLEQRYPDFTGLNLSAEVLDGQAFRAAKKSAATPSLEVQVVDAADSICYTSHDVDDALEIGLLSLEGLAEVPFWREAAARVARRWAGLAAAEVRRAVVHELIDFQVNDILEQSMRRLQRGNIATPAAVAAAGIIVEPSPALAEQRAEFARFLFQQVYRHPDVMAVRGEAQGWLRELFGQLVRRPELLPPRFQPVIAEEGAARAAGDYLSSMTDRYARQQHAELRAVKP